MNSKKSDGTYPTQSEKDRIESQISRINATLSKASDKKKDLEEKRLAAALPKVTALINQNPQISESELILKLNDIGLSESVYNDLKEKNMLTLNLSESENEIKTDDETEASPGKEDQSIA